MAGGAPKGNKNALKHGIFAVKSAALVSLLPGGGDARPIRDPSFAIRHLEEAIDEIWRRMENAQGDNFTKLANALSLATTALFNGHRTVNYLTGGMTPVEDAMKELLSLEFEED